MQGSYLMAFSREMIRHKGLFELTGEKYVDYNTSDTPLSVWSVPQFEQFQRLFSHGLGQLQHALNLVSTGQSVPGSTSLLTSAMVSMSRAMTKFLQRRYAMMQRLQGLGRVVETDSFCTWYAQPETAWLRKAIADLKAKCDAFSWVVAEICQTSQDTGHLPSSIMDPTSTTKQRTPILRNYNSFSSIGSEGAREWTRRGLKARNGSDASTPVTNPFSDSSSACSQAAFTTGPSSLNPNSPVAMGCKQAFSDDDEQYGSDSNSPTYSDGMLSVALRNLLQLDL